MYLLILKVGLGSTNFLPLSFFGFVNASAKVVYEKNICSVAGTFTLSNLGMFGVDRFDAILPPGTVSSLVYANGMSF